MKKKEKNRLFSLWIALLLLLLAVGVLLFIAGVREGPWFGLGSASV